MLINSSKEKEKNKITWLELLTIEVTWNTFCQKKEEKTWQGNWKFPP